MKRTLTSILMVIALIVPTFTATLSPVVSAASTAEVTVVGKRITGDNNYFEISLEVNGDYEEYSAVGVVLQYDPNYIVPADSWDDEAPAADMSAAVSWATRRALPTYGEPEWTTHTALAYESGGTGYLYLGAEYPGKQPGVTAPASDSAAAATPDPDDPHSKPVVAARFMYKGADETARKAMMNTIKTTWTAAWDSNWQSNTILKIAPDAVSGSSPAQYGFAYYGADFTERAFMYTFPAEATTSPASTTRAAYTPPAIGSAIAASNRLTAGDIEIVSAEGKSAKSGGLALSDVFAILFFDWDDSLIGTLTAGIGAKDMAATVNDYLNESLVHPDLRMDKKNYTALVSSGAYTSRENSYRGEYPYTGPNASNPTTPGGANTVTDGADYPLTNKLDYVFAGKNIDPELPFANGWVQVTTKDMDYSDKQGHWPDVLPKKMSDSVTWWANLYGLTFGRAPELNEDGTFKNASDTIPEVILYDFDNITASDLEYGDGNLLVKAAYENGETLNYGGDFAYATVGDPLTDVAARAADAITFSIDYNYRRINTAGYGVYRVIKPAVNMALTQIGASASTPVQIAVDNGDEISVSLTPTDAVETVGYQLRDTYKSSVVNGEARSAGDEYGLFEVGGASGLSFQIQMEPFLTQAYSYANGATQPTTWLTQLDLQELRICRTTAGAKFSTAAQAKQKQATLVSIVSEAAAELGNPGYLTLSWYQIQYGILRTSSPYYVSNSIAKAYCEGYPDMIDVLNNGF